MFAPPNNFIGGRGVAALLPPPLLTPLLIRRWSLNSNLERLKPYLFKGIVVTVKDASFTRAASIARFWSAGKVEDKSIKLP